MDNIEWLLQQRDREATSRNECFSRGDNGQANVHGAMSDRYYAVAEELRKLREINHHMTIALRDRVIIAVKKDDTKATRRPAIKVADG
jgi:hypothetical protein